MLGLTALADGPTDVISARSITANGPMAMPQFSSTASMR